MGITAEEATVSMSNVTMDTNCIIALEQSGAEAQEVKRIIQAHEAGLIALAVVAISASERTRTGVPLSSFAIFRGRLEMAGFRSVHILKPLARIGLSFNGWAHQADGKKLELERKIHGILFPQHPYEKPDPADPDASARWQNRRCDVLAMWAHIWHRGDIFMTNDRNFLTRQKRQALEALGAGRVVSPADVVRLVVP